MLPPYEEVLAIVQHLAPTWRVDLHRTCAEVLCAFWERSCLCLSDLARAMPAPAQPLHGRLKRLGRFLANPHLDELALSVRWLRLSYELVSAPPVPVGERPLLPILLDTVYFEPFALLLASVPGGSRGLPITLATYHRRTLEACFPPEATWPDPADPGWPELRRRRGLPARPRPAASLPAAFASQNRIEEHLLTLLGRLCSSALRPVTVADRGFARASLFQWHLARGRDFVIRVDAATHVYLTLDQPSQPVAQALAVKPGERRWAAHAWYHQDERVPCALLALWAPGAEEPWYLAATLDQAEWVETLYGWRMRCECTHRDEKTGFLLRCGGDAHRLTNVLHLHRLLLGLCLAEWLCALVGLQAWRDLPPAAVPPAALTPPLEAAPPASEPDLPYLAQGPAAPPPVRPHRGAAYKPPAWLRRFEGRGPLSYPRLGWEVLQAADLRPVVRRLAHWLGIFLWLYRPCWQPWQVRYRLRHWWPEARAA